MITRPAALLELELGTIWARDDRGRLQPAPEYAVPPPLLVVAAGAGTVAWGTSASLDDDTAAALDVVLAGLVPRETVPDVGWCPAAAAGLRAIVEAAAGPTVVDGGPSYVAAAPVPPPHGEHLIRTSLDTSPDALRGLMDEADRGWLRAPWAALMCDGVVAAVCETARDRSDAVEAGLWTYPPFRRRGFGVEVTVAWASLVADRAVFYSTDAANVASQRVAVRAGFGPFAQLWQLHAVDADR